jgi:hypothetical protein
MNITKVNGAYAKELYEHITEIRNILKDTRTTVGDMRQAVLDIIEPAWINAKAKPRFKVYLCNCKTKLDIYTLCWNSIHKAMRYRPASTY